MPRPRVRATLALMTAALLLAPAIAFAKPDFSRSTIAIDPAAPKEGDVITFLAHLRNSGDEPAPFTEVVFELPLEAMFVDVTGLDGAKVDVAEKVIAATLDLPVGADRQFTLRMVIPRDAGGRTLLPTLNVRYAYAGVEFRAGEPVTIDTRIAQTGIALGGVRFNRPSLVLLGVLLLYPVLRLLFGSRKEAKGPIVMIVIAVGFLAVFVGMAYDDWRTISVFRQSSCTILDTRLRIETSTSSTSSTSPSRRRQTTTSYDPLLALRYVNDGGAEAIGTGYSTDSRLDIGVGASSRTLREYEQWKIGAQVPCWFDPDDPARVMVLPGFGGAYFFALLPLGLLVAAIWGLVGTRRA